MKIKPHFSYKIIIPLFFLINIICVLTIFVYRQRINKNNFLVNQKNDIIDNLRKNEDHKNSILYTNIDNFGVDYNSYTRINFDGEEICLKKIIEDEGILLFQINLTENYYSYLNYFKKYGQYLMKRYKIIISFLCKDLKKDKYRIDLNEIQAPYLFIDIKDLAPDYIKSSCIIFLDKKVTINLLFRFNFSDFYKMNVFLSAIDRYINTHKITK